MTAKDIAASVRNRLQQYAKDTGASFEVVLNRFARERLLFRLSDSSHRDSLILKGAMLFSVWADKPFRSTRDADFLAFGPSDVASVVAVFREICGDGTVDPEDGARFDPESVRGAETREQAEYDGVRVQISAYLGVAHIPLKIDVGFGDSVVPQPRVIKYPTILDLPAPTLRGYPMESVISEKLHAMATHGSANSRMKDFYDVWVMQNDFQFEGETLAEAINSTFARRNTPVEPYSWIPFQSSFYTSDGPLSYWRIYVQRGDLERIPPPFSSIGAAIERFLRPVCESIAQGESFDLVWPLGGPWQGKEVQ